jgi:hypothetical protein
MASINLKQYYAAHAPAMPEWFVEKYREGRPELPDGKSLVLGDREQFAGMVKGTLEPINASLEAVALYREHQKAQAEQRRWDRDCHQKAFYEWRWFHADQMAKTEPKESSDAPA